MTAASKRGETARGRPARVSSADYKLVLPKSPRRLCGRLSVEEAAKRLTLAFHLHKSLMRAIAGRLIEVAEYELKIELAHHLYHHAEAANALRGRLGELRVPDSRRDGAPPDAVALLLEEAMHATASAEFVVGIHGVLARHLAALERDYLAECDPLLDLPSRRIFERTIADLDAMTGWSETVVEAFVKAGASREDLNAWRAHLEELLKAVGDLSAEPIASNALPCLRSSSAGPFERAIGCARDDRFETFHHTRSYRSGEPLLQAATGYEADRLEVIRVQRDELDAVETFANVLYDFEEAPFDLQMSLARFIWDEARHAEMGQQSLERLGYDPFEVPCGIIGINVRSPLPPQLAFAQINTLGELNQVGHLRRMAAEAYRRGDGETGRAIDFVHADELMHVRQGRVWLKWMAARSGRAIEDLTEEARREAVRWLHAEGVLDEDYRLDLTARQLHALLGE